MVSSCAAAVAPNMKGNWWGGCSEYMRMGVWILRSRRMYLQETSLPIIHWKMVEPLLQEDFEEVLRRMIRCT